MTRLNAAVAPFRFDITPPLGHALLGGWIPPAAVIDDPLEAIGYVLLTAEAPIVVCALDWAGVMNEAHRAWRETLAAAAGTTIDRVAVQCVHPHNTPFVCPRAHAAAARHPDLPAMFDPAFFADCLQRAHQAVRAALQRPIAVTHVAAGSARVEQVASNRRVARDADGRVVAMRRSSCNEPDLIALPEGTIDPELQTIAFYTGAGDRVLACHYYATHPMSYYADGRVSSDFCGLARKQRQAEDPGCTHVYFTGCAGNVSAGKYNDGSPAARRALVARMHAGMLASEATLRPAPLAEVDWRTTPVLPPPQPTPTRSELEALLADARLSLAERLVPAFRIGWLERVATGVPLTLSRLRLNDSAIVHLPGEMFVEYQLRAKALGRGRPVAVAAYGDDGLWYVPTRDEYPRGGYEVSVAFSAPDADELFTRALETLLEPYSEVAPVVPNRRS